MLLSLQTAQFYTPRTIDLLLHVSISILHQNFGRHLDTSTTSACALRGTLASDKAGLIPQSVSIVLHSSLQAKSRVRLAGLCRVVPLGSLFGFQTSSNPNFASASPFTRNGLQWKYKLVIEYLNYQGRV
jgi:hypothetical protein